MALQRLIQLKQRDVGKGLILAAARLEQLYPYIKPLTPAEETLILTDFGHAVSWIVPAAKDSSTLLTGGRLSLCVRVSAHPIVAALCEEYGGSIVSTSANQSGQQAATTLLGARNAFGDGVDYYLEGATGGARAASEIRDLASGKTLRPSVSEPSS